MLVISALGHQVHANIRSRRCHATETQNPSLPLDLDSIVRRISNARLAVEQKRDEDASDSQARPLDIGNEGRELKEVWDALCRRTGLLLDRKALGHKLELSLDDKVPILPVEEILAKTYPSTVFLPFSTLPEWKWPPRTGSHVATW